MTYIQEQAIELIQQLPDEKIQAFITLASDEIKLMEFKRQEQISKKKQAFEKLEALHLDLPDDLALDTPEFKDFEDCIQTKCAKTAKADYIITRNKQDFSESEIPVLTPQEWLELQK